MNLRKFTFIISFILAMFLFGSGIIVLSFGGHDNNLPPNHPFRKIIDPFFASGDPVNILLLGGDKVNQNTDTMMLINFNPETMKVSVLSIPRDTKVIIDNNIRKINYAFPKGGPQLAVDAVCGLLNVNINYYFYVDTSVFRNIIDLLGGIKHFYIPVNMDYDDNSQNLHIHFTKGYHDLDGKSAEEFMRFRKGKNLSQILEYYDGSDTKRINAQQTLLKELVRQKAKISYLPKLNSVINEIFSHLETNMQINEALKLIPDFTIFNTDNLQFFTLPGVPEEEGLYYYVYNKAETEKLINEYFHAKGNFINRENRNIFPGTFSSPASSNINNTPKPTVKPTNVPKPTPDVTVSNPSNDGTSVTGDPTPNP